jgi:exonuclease III
MVKEKRPNMVFLTETKLQAGRLDFLKNRLGFDGLFVVNSKGKSGGLALFWQESFHVSIQNYSKNHINAVIYSEALDVRWKFSGFYGNPEVCKRWESWALLRHLESFSPIPWLCCGDFNEILDASEKRGGARRPETQMKEFQNALEHCRLCDMGSWYTWSNKRHDDYFTEERLDRMVANLEFASLFPRLCVEVIAARTSDHAPLFCSLQGFTGGQRMGRKIFRFEAWWQKEHGFARRSNRFGK